MRPRRPRAQTDSFRREAHSPRRSVSEGPPLRRDGARATTLHEALRRAARDSAARGVRYVEFDGQQSSHSYRELLERAEALGGALQKRLPKEKQPVLLLFDRPRDLIEAFWASLLAGRIPAPILWPGPDPARGLKRLTTAWTLLDRPAALCRQSGISGLAGNEAPGALRLVTIEELEGEAASRARADHQPSEEDVAIVLFTSGSTAGLKAVPLSHRNLIAMAAGTTQRHGFSQRDTTLNWLPLDHVGAISFLHIMPTWLGCPQIHAATSYVLADILRWLDLASHHGATISWAPNFAFRLLANRGEEIGARRWDLSRLRFLVSAGESVVPATLRDAWRLLAPHGLPGDALRPAFGMSETCSGITWADRLEMPCDDEERLRELGPPIAGASLRIVDDADVVVGERTTGHLQVRGPSVMSGYWGNPQATRAAFTADGWFRTGDLGFLSDGRLTLVGREKDILIVRGVHYAAEEIEAAVEELHGVRPTFTAACAARENGEDEQLVLFLVPDEQRRREQLLAEVQRQLTSRHGLKPWAIVFLREDQVPKTGIGKLQRGELLRRWKSGEIDPRQTAFLAEPKVLYRVQWSPARMDRTQRGARANAGAWIIVPDTGDFATRLTEYLSAGGLRPWIVLASDLQPIRRDECERIVDQMPRGAGNQPINILHASRLSATGAAQDVDQVRLELQRDLGHLVHVLQAIRVPRPNVPIRLALVTRGAQGLPGDSAPPDVIGAAMWGYLRSAALDDPMLFPQCVDLDPAAKADDLELALDELLHGDEIPEVAYRAWRRYVPVLREAPEESAVLFQAQAEATYLITGGLGGLASSLVEWLIDQGAGRVLVVSRRPVEREQAGSRVDYLSADVSTAEGLARIKERLGPLPPLAGVFHLAGIADHQRYLEHTLEHIDHVLAGKGIGALRLLKEFAGCPMVFFSSMLSVLGGARQSAYSAACALLDALAERESRQGQPIVSIQWGPWSGPGMASAGKTAGSAAASSGIRPFARDQGLRVLSRILGNRRGQLLAIDADWQRFSATHPRPRQLAALRPLLSGTAAPTLDENQIDRDDLPRQTEERRVQVCLSYLQRQLGQLLGRGIGAEELERSFAEMGIDSVGAAALLGRVARLLDRTPPIDLLTRHDSATELARYLAARLGEPD
jgi:acyl-CoA synthetase (AMP-forming)/AMP-acid ligase II/NAD(P)-dependent dehydrogenase (short-subunit alcohol dehydrogenase family)